ncbi:MAG TPA: heme-binding protein [Candidatus Acidoferrales bacterium]|nr:heme-binding protein [Candidatus Acidoferrales bacterium]
MSDVSNLVQAAAQAANDDTMIIAVVDRVGNPLAVYRKPSAPAMATGNFGNMVNANDLAVALARTAAFFSNDQAPLSSRTVRFISGIHFPPGVMNQPNADLYGIENTNRGCQLVPAGPNTLPPATALAGGPGLGILTGKADVMDSQPFAVNPGGVPIFKTDASGNTYAIGGIGVVASTLDVAEYAAFAAAFSNGFGLTPAAPGVVIVGGIALPFVNNTTRPAGFTAGTADGAYLAGFPIASPGLLPEGDLITPTNGPMGGLTAAQVTEILDATESTANQIRGVIRLPIGARAKMVFAVADLDGTLIGLRRMHDATIFSVDVASSKARNMVYFNSSAVSPNDMPGVPIGTAVTNRTISFGAMPLYPPGIDGTSPGPFFNLFLNDVAHPCTQGSQPTPGAPPTNQSGIVFFPGSTGLYVNGTLVGGLGISGDGVDQDDFVTNGGASGGINFVPTCSGPNCYLPPPGIRADQIFDQGVRLPFSKFPRNPTN